ncbi:protein of unknown function [Magnetospirillum sp. XM-1]|nr:protein of unknown function [Magnetospirillum sp. XM-1]
MKSMCVINCENYYYNYTLSEILLS